ncbi:MAG: hypothetical protein MR839_06755 [Spirochaetia bacterium]|nr:hypothetical protein [Spirochaetia bacterium]
MGKNKEKNYLTGRNLTDKIKTTRGYGLSKSSCKKYQKLYSQADFYNKDKEKQYISLF